jgi:hypothetical protein
MKYATERRADEAWLKASFVDRYSPFLVPYPYPVPERAEIDSSSDHLSLRVSLDQGCRDHDRAPCC